MSSYADAQRHRQLEERVAALEKLAAPDALYERLQRLEMRLGGLQGQINALRAKAPPAPLGAALEPVESDAARQ